MNSHTYHLKAVEAELDECPILYLIPVWAHRDTFAQPLSIPFGTPYQGLVDIALRVRLDWLSSSIEATFVSTRHQPCMLEVNAIRREMKATQLAMTVLQRQIGGRVPTIGEKCAAWAAEFDMPGVLLSRSQGDETGGFRLCRNVQSAVDRFVAEWEVRALDDGMAIAAQVGALPKAPAA